MEKKKFNRKEYDRDYKKTNYIRYFFRVRKDDKEFIDFLEKQENKTAYITGLIRKDMQK